MPRTADFHRNKHLIFKQFEQALIAKGERYAFGPKPKTVQTR